MSQQQFYMMVGLAGSGKSSVAQKYAEKMDDCVIHASDELRKEMFGSYESNRDQHQLVFAELHKRIIADITAGKSVVFDATNLNYRHRRALLDKLPRDLQKIAIVVATTVEDCIHNDNERERKVGEGAILSQWKRFTFPVFQEGFDAIIIEYGSKVNPKAVEEMLIEKCEAMEQHNPHHTMTVGGHMASSYEQCFADKGMGVSNNVYQALKWHDVGKLYTQTFDDYGVAHYYGHMNVSAYEAMFMVNWGQMQYNPIKVLQYIQWHMLPFFINTKKNERKWKQFFGQKFWNDLKVIHEYDRRGR